MHINLYINDDKERMYNLLQPNVNVPVFELLEGIELANDFIYEAIDCEVEKIEETVSTSRYKTL